jgi:hypothetical protein
MLPK